MSTGIGLNVKGIEKNRVKPEVILPMSINVVKRKTILYPLKM